MIATRFHQTMLLKRLVSNFMSSLSFTSSSSEPCVLKIGNFLRKSRNFSDQDVLDYSKLTHDMNPLHFDSKCAQDAGFEDRIVHGMLVASLFPQIIASHFPGAVYVSQNLHFKLPVYIGEEVVAQIQALNIRENKKKYISRQNALRMGSSSSLMVRLLPYCPVIDEKDTISLLARLLLISHTVHSHFVSQSCCGTKFWYELNCTAFPCYFKFFMALVVISLSSMQAVLNSQIIYYMSPTYYFVLRE